MTERHEREYEHGRMLVRFLSDGGLGEERLENVYHRVAEQLRREPASVPDWLRWSLLSAVAITAGAAMLIWWPSPAPLAPDRPIEIASQRTSYTPLTIVKQTGTIAGGKDRASLSQLSPKPEELDGPFVLQLAVGSRVELRGTGLQLAVVGPGRIERRVDGVLRVPVGLLLASIASPHTDLEVEAGDQTVVASAARFAALSSNSYGTHIIVRQGTVMIGDARGQQLTVGSRFSELGKHPPPTDWFLPGDPWWSTETADEPPSGQRAIGKPTVREAAADPWKAARIALRKQDCVRVSELSIALAPPTASNDVRARARALAAECALRSGRTRQALRLYRSIASEFGQTPAGETAYFESARLSMGLDDPRSALALFDLYRRNYPQGRFFRQASLRRCELLVELGEDARAKKCIDEARPLLEDLQE